MTNKFADNLADHLKSNLTDFNLYSSEENDFVNNLGGTVFDITTAPIKQFIVHQQESNKDVTIIIMLTPEASDIIRVIFIVKSIPSGLGILD
jgi:hypothetical protein